MQTPCVDKCRRRIEILSFFGENGVYGWQSIGSIWADVSFGSGRNNYSSAGIGAENIRISARNVPIGLDNAISINGKHCIITRIEPTERRGWVIIDAAQVRLADCVGLCERSEAERVYFPAIITEKYIRHERVEPMSTNIISYVLITPKNIELEAGGLIKADGIMYEIQCCHMLGEHKNEYEAVRTIDL